MRILAAFDKCKDSLSAREICSLAKQVILTRSSLDQVQTIPLTDGGEGFAELLTLAKGGTFHPVSVKDSLGRENEVKVGLISIENLCDDLLKFMNLNTRGKIAVIEMASVVGLCNLRQSERNPWLTSTYGVGQLLKEVSSLGSSSILLGIGGSSTNDMGVGALSALGVNLLDQRGNIISFPSPIRWPSVDQISIDNLMELPPIRIACDVSNSLLGKNGATYQFASQKGLPIDQIDKMEEEVIKMSETLSFSFHKTLDSRKNEGTGAAGGIGYGLNLAYDAEFVPGFSLTEKWFGLEDAIKRADLILTGEGRFDSTSLYGKGPYEIIRLASKFNKKVIVLAGAVEENAVAKCKSEFSNLNIVSFGNKDLPLQENFDRVTEFFSKKLIEQLSLN
jgi:glycerate kinase